MRKHAISFAHIDKVTRDSFEAECDINNIVDTFLRTGQVNHLPRTQPQYGDAPDLSYYEASCIAAEAASAEEEGYPRTQDEIVESEPSEAVSEDPDTEGVASQSAAPGESVAAE